MPNSSKMEPVSRLQLQTSYDVAQEKIRDKDTEIFVNWIYSSVIDFAEKNKCITQYIHKDDCTYGVNKTTNRLSMVSEKVLERLKVLFPDSVVKVIEIQTQIKTDWQGHYISNSNKPELRSAIVIDWS